MATSKEQQEENKKVILRFHELLNALEMEKTGEVFADDAVMGVPGKARALEGGKQITEWLIGLLSPLKAFEMEILDFGAVGPWVIDERIDWGKTEDGERGTHVAGSYLVKDGKILDWTEWVSSEKPTSR